MKTLKFMGFSDDTFGECREIGEEIDNCASCKPIQCAICADDEALVVIGQYDRFGNGCWDIGICQLNEETPIPDWHMCFSSEDYSAVLEIDVPDDFTLTWYDNGEECEE